MLKHKQWLRFGITLLTICVSLSAPAAAATTKAAATKATTTSSASQSNVSSVQTVAQSYTTAKPLQQGLIVQLVPKSTTAVMQASYKDAKKMLGVVVPANSTAVSLSSDAAGQQAYVVTSGRYNVLVSNQNGAIADGDYVSISAIDGIGMKADGTEPEVLGRAVGSFDGKTNTISTATLKTSDGKQLKVAIGTMSVDIATGINPTESNGNSGVPKIVQNIAKTLVGKAITAPQLYASAAVLIAGLGVVASLLYSGIQTGMTAIGRNPLAKQSIMRNLIQVVITGVMIFIGCLIAVYLILKI